MTRSEFELETDSLKALADKRLGELFGSVSGDIHKLSEAMRYSLLAGGKRIRPILLLSFCKMCSGDVEKAVDAACAVELLHTYSLIHDDLPCMDNDDLRRGKPTNHVVYGEWQAMLAGDALQAEAFCLLAASDMSPTAISGCVKELSAAAGLNGICGGQYLDLATEGIECGKQQLERISLLKTSALISAACAMGCLAGKASPEQICAAKEYGRFLGLAFQIRDDLLNVYGEVNEIGKATGTDSDRGRETFASLLGAESAEKLTRDYTEQACSALDKSFKNTELLKELARRLCGRVK